VALVFVALVALALLVASGSMRSRLRVYISKNFFSYRYDYREEWLRFTQLLSGSAEPQHTAETVVRALANLVESPSGMLWMQRAPAATSCRRALEPAGAVGSEPRRALRASAGARLDHRPRRMARAPGPTPAWSCRGWWTSRAAGCWCRCWCARR
jgi:hypothetical protein